MRSARYRARLAPRDLAKFFRENAESDPRPLNTIAHEAAHTPEAMVYTSPSTLSTSAGAVFPPPRGGQILRVLMSVKAAGATNTVADILLNGVSIFPTSTKPKVTAGSLVGYFAVADRVSFRYQDYFQVQLTATGGATGPAVVVIEYFPEL